MSAFTPEVRERLEHVARRWPSGMRVGTQSDWLPATPYDVVCALTHIDALEAEAESRFAQVAAAGVRVLELEKRVAVLAAALNEAADAWPRPNKYDDILGALEGGSRG